MSYPKLLFLLWVSIGKLLYSPTISSAVSDDDSSIRFLTIADWGGRDVAPYSTPSQNHTSVGMEIIATNINSQFILAFGDNIYDSGIQTDANDPRFAETWHAVYTASALQIPWYLCAGNHDHLGNVTAQIEYSLIADNWNFPSLYYSESFSSLDGNVTLDVIMIDTTTYTGVNTGDVYPTTVADTAQQEWIEAQLSASTADYVIVAGHYPIYDACSHGNTETLIVNLLPLLNEYEGMNNTLHGYTVIDSFLLLC